MEDLYKIRRQNLQTLCEDHKGTFEDFASSIRLTPKGLYDHLHPEKPRKLGAKRAREIEKKRELYPGWLDERHATPEEKKSLARFLDSPPDHIDRAYTLTEFAQHNELFASILASLEPLALRELSKLHDKQHVAAAKKRKRKAS